MAEWRDFSDAFAPRYTGEVFTAGTVAEVERERLYIPVELEWLVRETGFGVEHVGGGAAGAWARRPLELDEYEIMIIARRGGDDA